MRYEPVGLVNKPDHNKETFVTYKGNLIFTFDGWLLCIIVVMLTCGVCMNIADNPGASILCIMGGAFFFIVGVNRFYYFNCSANNFVVQNHFMFWIKEKYNLRDLDQISFEMPFRTPGSVRLITRGSGSRPYPAASLSDRQWIALKEHLEKLNVPIHDEFVDNIVFFEFTLFKEIKEIFSRSKQK